MSEFLRTPKNGEVKDGESFTDVRHGEVVAQKNCDGECLEVRKSLKHKDGEHLSSKERAAAIEEAKEEVDALYEKAKKKSEKKEEKEVKKEDEKLEEEVKVEEKIEEEVEKEVEEPKKSKKTSKKTGKK